MLITAALWNRAGHYIFALWFLMAEHYIFAMCFLLSSIFFFFFPRLISAVVDWMRTIHMYFHTWCGLSANLGRRSETCCMRLTKSTGRKKSPKTRHLRTIAQLCRAISSQRRHVWTNEKNLLNSDMSPHVLTIWRNSAH